MANAKASPNLEALPTSPSLAQTLPSDAVLDALKMILLGAPLNEVLTTITRLIEAHSTGMLCSIFLLDEDSMHLRYGVAASLPEAYRAATDGICIGPNVGSCGTAAYLRQPVFDIASDPRWVKFRDFALQSGLRAAWSTPIMSHDGKVLGTFGMYYREVRSRRIILWKTAFPEGHAYASVFEEREFATQKAFRHVRHQISVAGSLCSRLLQQYRSAMR